MFDRHLLLFLAVASLGIMAIGMWASDEHWTAKLPVFLAIAALFGTGLFLQRKERQRKP